MTNRTAKPCVKMRSLVSLIVVILLIATQSAFTMPNAKAVSSSPLQIRTTQADGAHLLDMDGLLLDCSHAEDGYIVVCESAEPGHLLSICGPDSVRYSYTLSGAEDDPFTVPLSAGSGVYAIELLSHVRGNSYSVEETRRLPVALCSEAEPFLYPSRMVDYDAESQAVGLAAQLTENCKDEWSSLYVLYCWVADNMRYDHELAEDVEGGYVCDVDRAVTEKTGICLDYATLLTAMLRSRGIPAQLVFGYIGGAYHAWVSAFVDGAWLTVDPTLDDRTLFDPASILADESLYEARYVY